MKKLAAALFAVTALAAVAFAWMVPTYQTTNPNESALTYNNTYAIQTNNTHIDTLSYQCLYASASIVNTNFSDPNIGINSAVISATNPYTTANAYQGQNGALGFGVWLSTSAGFAPAPLKANTTYFVIPVDTSHFKLALTSTGAVAGLGVVLTSSATTDTFTLHSEVIAGTPSFKWQVSNDGSHWDDLLNTPYNVSVSSITMLTYVSTGTATMWDFGPFDYTWLRLNVIAPTQGGIQLQCFPNGEGATPN